MRWPPWSSKSTNDNKPQQEPSSLSSSSHPTPSTNNPSTPLDWTAFTEPRTLVPTLLLTSGILLAVRFHRRYLRRFPDAPSISPSFLRRRTVFGQVTSVGDGDNFRIFHTPGGRLAGWGWLPWKKVPASKKELKDNTVRLSNSYPLFSGQSRRILSVSFHATHIFLFFLDPHPSSWHRRPGTRTFRSTRTTLRPRRPRLAHLLPTQPPHSRLHLSPRPVPARRGKCDPPARIRLPTLPSERCLVRDAETRSGDCVRRQSGGGVWRRGHGAEVSSC